MPLRPLKIGYAMREANPLELPPCLPPTNANIVSKKHHIHTQDLRAAEVFENAGETTPICRGWSDA
ncbi:hypothetical protein KIN20_036281 [Parelaphostrongylus tenuis]|uniref:Uncharacterized protein n=1 Tax=Parelaphostrongylus tenuis TaxID=148309 RepID=A0AAD5WL66_PARTN|nr:hypothetical protein KIN20_036281 [Parelaphostrongylus tenuis]